MSSATVNIERQGKTAILQLDRPPANALDTAFLNRIGDALDELSTDPGWGSLVVAGGDGLFCAGVDLKQLPGLDLAGQHAIVNALNRVYLGLYALERPTVAAIGGHAIAGGLIMALCCDYRVSTTGPCRLGLTEVKVGVAFPVSALEVARAELAPAVFRRFLLFGGLVDPRTALSDGVVDELAKPAEVMPAALGRAAELAALPVSGYSAVKTQMRAGTLDLLRDAYENATEPLLGGWFGDEARKAAARVLAGKA